MSRISDRAPRGRRPRRLAVGAAVAGGMLLSVAAIGPAAASAASPTGVEATLPVNAATNPGVVIRSVSCPSAGNCTAVGSYIDSSDSAQVLLLTETAGTWARGVEAALPANAVAAHQVAFGMSVSCASAGNCTAVGTYLDSSSIEQGLLLTETAGVWSTGVEATLPANGIASFTTLGSVSCASAGNCTAIGTYLDSAHDTQGLLVTETAGVWSTGVEAPLPAGTAPDPQVVLRSVSCASADNCTAVGFYLDSADNGQGLLLTETAGVWSAGVEATLPTGATASEVKSVSCASAGNCTAVGTYIDSAGNGQGLLLTQTSGAWAKGVQATPANAFTNPTVGLTSVSCASVGNCTAVGNYYDTAANVQGVLLTETAGSWATPVEMTPPAGAATNPGVGLASVSCASAGNCTAVGLYFDSSNNTHALLVNQTGGLWTPGVEVTLPTNAGTNPAAQLFSVSCSLPGSCTAVGGYYDSIGPQGLLVTTVAPPPPPDFTDLIADSTGVGPGMSLVDKALAAQAQTQAGTIASACVTLNEYVKLVKAQTPRTISRSVAADVTGDAASIATQLGC